MKKIKLGLLIQGPIISNGITGKDYGRILKHDAVFEEYDSTHCIKKNISKFGNLFDEVVISTWLDQPKLNFNYPNTKIYYFDDKQIQKFQNNMYKHMNGIAWGLEKFSDVGYVIKIRTDQFIDLNLFYLNLKKNNFFDNKIIIPFAMKKNISIADFFYSAQLNVLKKFIDFILNGELHSKSIHINQLFNYIYNNYYNYLKIKKNFYFPPFTNLNSLKIYRYGINEVFQPFEKEIYSNIIFRGYRLNSYHKKRLKKNYIFLNENLTRIDIFRIYVIFLLNKIIKNLTKI